MNCILEKMDISSIDMIKAFYLDIFANEPWNDDWTNEKQLHEYIMDLIGNANSLTLGYFLDSEMVGLCMGHIRHWYTGTEYYIDEFCICRNKQGVGIGTKFLKDVEQYIIDRDITRIFLLTERNVPAYHFYKTNKFVELSEHVSFAKKLSYNQ